MNGRDTNLIIILGYTGTGKTTITQRFVNNEVQKKSRVLIVMPDDREWEQYPYIDMEDTAGIKSFTGAKKTAFLEKYTLNQIMDHYHNGMLVFEDMRSYMGSITNQELHFLLIRRRQMMIDIIAVAHGFTEVPPKFFTFANYIILFRTKDNIFSRKNYLKDFEKMKDAQERVNMKADSNPHYYEIIEQ